MYGICMSRTKKQFYSGEKVMASVIIRNERNVVILDSELQSITPLGFESQIPEESIKLLRDQSGRLVKLFCELYLEAGKEPICISGSVSVNAIRRVSQNVSLLVSRFTELEQGAYQYIAEYINHGKVVSVNIAHSAAKRRA